MGGSQQRELAAVRDRQLIKQNFAISSEITPFIIPKPLLLDLVSGEEWAVDQ